MEIPTINQFKTYRARRREAVNRIVLAYQAGCCGMTEWTRGVIARSRKEHSESIRRQTKLTARGAANKAKGE